LRLCIALGEVCVMTAIDSLACSNFFLVDLSEQGFSQLYVAW
jgi:hypothetical protein